MFLSIILLVIISGEPRSQGRSQWLRKKPVRSFFPSLCLTLTTYSPNSSSSTAPTSRSFPLVPLPCSVCLPVDELRLLCPGCPCNLPQATNLRSISNRQCSKAQPSVFSYLFETQISYTTLTQISIHNSKK